MRRILRIEWISLFAISISSIVIFFHIIVEYYQYLPIVTATFFVYILHKIILYNFFLERLFLIFNDTDLRANQFKSCQTFILRSVTFIWPFLLIVLFLIMPPYRNGSDGVQVQALQHLIMAFIMIVGDLSVSLTISILFSRRLLLIESSSNNSQHTLLKRCLILSVFSIIILLFHFLLTIILGLGKLWTVLDVTMNSWCILLSFTEYDKIYWKVFGKLHNCIGHKCLLCYTCYCCSCYKIEDGISDSKSMRKRDIDQTMTNSTGSNAITIDSTNKSADNTEKRRIERNGKARDVTPLEVTSNELDTKSMNTASSTNTLDLEIARQQNKAFLDKMRKK